MSAVQASGAALTFGLHVLIARRFGSDVYGVFAHAVALSGLLAMLAPVGWNNAIVRFVSQYRTEHAWSALAGAWKTCASTTFALSAATSAVLLGCGLFLEAPRALRMSFFLSAALVPVMSRLEITRRALQGLSRFAVSLVPEQVVLPLVALGGAWMIAPREGAGFLLSWYASAAVVALLLAYRQLAAAFPAESRASAPVFKRREWHLTALPMLGSSIGYLVLNRLDVALLGMMVSMSEVGSYSAARRVVMLGSFAMASLNSVSAPSLAASHHRRDHREFGRSVRRVRMISSAVGLPVFAALLLFPDVFLGIFAVADAEARTVMRILVLGQIVNVATGPVGTAMAMSGRERPQAIICGLTAALAVATMPFAVSRWGVVGAASITAASIALQNILMLLALQRIGRTDYAEPERARVP